MSEVGGDDVGEDLAKGGSECASGAMVTTKVAMALAVLSGVLTGFSHPVVVSALGPEPIDPSGLTGLLALVGLVPLLVATKGRSVGRAFALAFFAAWVHFVIVGHWLVVAFSHFGGLPFVAGVFAMGLVVAGLALFPALAIPAANLIEERLGWSRWWVFPFTFAGAELLHDFIPFQGVPWGHPGVALGTVDVVAQSAAVVGVYGLVAFAGLTNGVLAHVVTSRIRGEQLPSRALVVVGVTLAIVLGYGAIRLQAPPIPEGTPTVKFGLLQASIPQKTLNTGGVATSKKIRAIYHELQDEAVAKGADVVVWPEAALRPGARGNIDNLGRAGSMSKEVWDQGAEARMRSAPRAAIVGAVSTHASLDMKTGKRNRVLRTSAFATGPGFEVVGRWDKVNLLPFGEYVPFPLGSIIDSIVKVAGKLRPGEAHRVVKMPIAGRDVVVGTTICYEGVFPGVSRRQANDGAEVLVNITNDAWYGTSSEMPQHLVHYRLRAIETGRAVARAANSGISGWIDSRGRVWAKTNRDEKTVVVVDIPLLSETPPVRYLGDWLAVLSLAFSLVAIWLALFRRRTPSKDSELNDDNAPDEAMRLLISWMAAALVPACMATSAWAPVNEGVRTLCDLTAGGLVFACLTMTFSSIWLRRLTYATWAAVVVLGVLGAVYINIVGAGFVCVAAFVIFALRK